MVEECSNVFHMISGYERMVSSSIKHPSNSLRVRLSTVYFVTDLVYIHAYILKSTFVMIM